MKPRTCASPTNNYSRLKACNLLLQPYVNLSLQPPCIITSLTLVISMVTDSLTDVNICVQIHAVWHLFKIYQNVFLKHIFFSHNSWFFLSKCSSVSQAPVSLLSPSSGPQDGDGAACRQTLSSVWERGLHGNVLDWVQSRAPGFYLKHAGTLPGGWAQRRPPANETVVTGHCYYSKGENEGQMMPIIRANGRLAISFDTLSVNEQASTFYIQDYCSVFSLSDRMMVLVSTRPLLNQFLCSSLWTVLCWSVWMMESSAWDVSPLSLGSSSCSDYRISVLSPVKLTLASSVSLLHMQLRRANQGLRQTGTKIELANPALELRRKTRYLILESDYTQRNVWSVWVWFEMLNRTSALIVVFKSLFLILQLNVVFPDAWCPVGHRKRKERMTFDVVGIKPNVTSWCTIF